MPKDINFLYAYLFLNGDISFDSIGTIVSYNQCTEIYCELSSNKIVLNCIIHQKVPLFGYIVSCEYLSIL